MMGLRRKGNDVVGLNGGQGVAAGSEQRGNDWTPLCIEQTLPILQGRLDLLRRHTWRESLPCILLFFLVCQATFY